MEGEQTEMNKTITRTKEDERAAVKQAERIIFGKSVEKVSSVSTDRIPEDWSVPVGVSGEEGNVAVMRDILAENNHLQSALSELRDMLLTSQEEVGALREQLMDLGRVHRRRNDTDTLEQGGACRYWKEKVVPRRVKRRGRTRLTLDPSRRGMTTPDIDSTPITPASARFQRWSQLSSHTGSSSGRGLLSFPGSPQSVSTFRDSSIFNRDYGMDSTRPGMANTEWDFESVQKFSDRSRRRPRDSAGGLLFSVLYTEEFTENLSRG
ncbi:hypothetical protein BGX38DRAFT_1278641 [Terfezia claveryi]|nr:hypothetical protein BGX38DRAFT_1278641 [Terfezia claveryi]